MNLFNIKRRNRETWDGRYNLILKIANEFVSSSDFGGYIKIDYAKLSDAIYNKYPKELKKTKDFHVIERLANDFKVSAVTTIVVYNSRCVQVAKSGSGVALCLMAQEMFAIFLGLANLGDPDEMLQGKEKLEMDIYSLMKHKKITYESLWTFYETIALEYYEKQKELLIPYHNENPQQAS